MKLKELLKLPERKPKVGKGYKRKEKVHHEREDFIEFVLEIDDTHVQMSDTLLSIPLTQFWGQFKPASDKEIRQFKIEESENKIRFLKEQIQIHIQKLELELIERGRL